MPVLLYELDETDSMSFVVYFMLAYLTISIHMSDFEDIWPSDSQSSPADYNVWFDYLVGTLSNIYDSHISEFIHCLFILLLFCLADHARNCLIIPYFVVVELWYLFILVISE